jgi:hypothetical protein
MADIRKLVAKKRKLNYKINRLHFLRAKLKTLIILNRGNFGKNFFSCIKNSFYFCLLFISVICSFFNLALYHRIKKI